MYSSSSTPSLEEIIESYSVAESFVASTGIAEGVQRTRSTINDFNQTIKAMNERFFEMEKKSMIYQRKLTS